MAFDFVTDEDGHFGTVSGAPRGHDETRLAIFGFVVRFDGPDFGVENAFPIRSKTIVIQRFGKDATDFAGPVFFASQQSHFVFIEARFDVPVIFRRMFERVVTVHDEAIAGLLVDIEDGGLSVMILLTTNTGSHLGRHDGIMNAVLEDFENGAIDVVLGSAIVPNLVPVSVDAIADDGSASKLNTVVPKTGAEEVVCNGTSFPFIGKICKVGRGTNSDRVKCRGGLGKVA